MDINSWPFMKVYRSKDERQNTGMERNRSLINFVKIFNNIVKCTIQYCCRAAVDNRESCVSGSLVYLEIKC